MGHRAARMPHWLWLRRTSWISTSATWAWLSASGCAGPWNRPLPEGAYIQKPLPTESVPPAPIPEALPKAPFVRSTLNTTDPSKPATKEASEPGAEPAANAPLALNTVLVSVANSFPLLYATELERSVAAGQLMAAEGQFDLQLNSRFVNQAGSFDSRVFDINFEQPTPFQGVSFTGGYRGGFNDFPSYNGGNLTADGGEFRFGVSMPLLRGRPIDSRRARVRAAQITQQIADPAIRRARLDFFLGATRAYWTWVQAGARYEIAMDVLKLAEIRSSPLKSRLEKGADRGDIFYENERQLNERKAASIQARRILEQAALNLSLFYRDENGNPVVPKPEQLPKRFIDFLIPKPDVTQLSQDVATALQQRPELVRFQLLRQRLGVDLQLALNDIFPTLNVTSNIAQDIGAGSRTLDRTNYQAGVVFALPVARRDALGRTGAAQAQIVQTLLSERDAQDRIVAEVQDAISELNAAYARVETNRKALEEAIKVRDLEELRFGRDLNNILQLNIQEVLAVQAENGVVDALADFLRALALYQTALGIEANPEQAGQTVTTPRPIGQLPEVNRDPKDFPFNRPEPEPGPGQKLPVPRLNPPVEVPPLPNPKQP